MYGSDGIIGRETLGRVIKKALNFAYTATSCKDNIRTGNAYQSIDLGGETLKGFRSGRNQVLDLLDFEGKTVLDIGSNLGEMCRNALKRSARHVTGVEYDSLFSLIAELITIYHGFPESKYDFVQNDVTKKYGFDQVFDVVLAFSVFTYIDRRLADVASSTREILLVETHVVDDRLEQNYIAPLRSHFPTVIVLGSTDWGLADQFSSGKRAVLACTKRRATCWSIIHRYQDQQPNLGLSYEVDIGRSEIPALKELRGLIKADMLPQAMELPLGEPVDAHLSLTPPSSLSNAAYWLEFMRGYKSWIRSGGLSEEDPYIRTLHLMMANDSHFDSGAQKQMQTQEALVTRVLGRYENFKVIESGDQVRLGTPILFSVAGEPAKISMAIAASDQQISGSRIDGYHRLAAAMLSGVHLLRINRFEVYGQL